MGAIQNRNIFFLILETWKYFYNLLIKHH